MSTPLGLMQEQIVRIVLPRDRHLDEHSATRLAAHLQVPRSGSPLAVLRDVTDVASVSDIKSGPARYFTSEPEAVEWLKENSHVR